MKATIGIPPADFVQRMEAHWVNELENVSNPALKESWHQIASAFEHHIKHHDDLEKAREWAVLSPPTGSGKSESIVIYGAMLSGRTNEEHPGLLVVTRLIEDCEAMAERINRYGDQETAVAYHSKLSGKLKLSELHNWPVVVITHRAYEMALDFLGHEDRADQTWSFFHEYAGNGQLPKAATGNNPFMPTRRLIVIDECLDIIDHRSITLDSLRNTLGQIPQKVRDNFQVDIDTIDFIINLLDGVDRATKGKQPGERMVIEAPVHHKYDNLKDIQPPDMSALIKALRDVRFDMQIGKDDPLECERLRNRHEQVLRSLHYIFRSWVYAHKNGPQNQFNTARLLIPEGIKGCVVMDATASTNHIYELHADSRMEDPPADSRNYQNVTLHVSNGHRVGKVYMEGNASKLTGQLIENLNGKLQGRKVLVVTHKKVEPLLLKYDPSFELFTGHWGAVDGSNAWKDCDTVVIFGFPYMPDYWSPNVFMALQGAQTTEWLQNDDARGFGEHPDIRHALKSGKISTSIIQAINRVRCRRTVDSEGNCEPTDVFLLLPNGKTGDAVLTDIIRMMPGIQVDSDWKYVAQKKKKRGGKWEPALIKYLENMNPGRYTPKRITKDLGMSPRTMATLTKKCQQSGTDLFNTMAERGIAYHVTGSGQRQKAYFVKP